MPPRSRGAAQSPAARRALRASLCAALLGLGAGACLGTLGDTAADGEGEGAHDSTGIAGGDVGAGGEQVTPPPSGGSGGADVAPTGGSGGSGGYQDTGGSGGAPPSGGSGGTPLLCVASGPKDCSPTPDPQCPDGAISNGNFAAQVGAAVQYVRNLPANASWFDYDGQPACCPKVGTGSQADKVMFRDAVIDRLNTFADLCAQADPGNFPHEITVKLNNDCSEGYIVLTSQGVVRNPPKHSYNCVPANI